MVHIHLVGAYTVHQGLGTAGAELLGLVAVDDKERRPRDAFIRTRDALAQEVVCSLVAGVEVGLAVHQVLVEGHAQRLLGMGEELQVYHLVGVRCAVGEVGRRQVGELRLVERVLGVVVAEVVLQRMQRRPLLLAVGGMRHRAAALVVHPSAPAVGRPVGDGAARQRVAIEQAQLVERQVGVPQALVAHIAYRHPLRLYHQLISLIQIGLHRQSVDAELLDLQPVAFDLYPPAIYHHLLRRGYQAEVDVLLCGGSKGCKQEYKKHTMFHKNTICRLPSAAARSHAVAVLFAREGQHFR